MTLLYISYWGINDGLSGATIFPYFKKLTVSGKVSKIIFITVERGEFSIPEVIKTNRKILHVPILSAGLNVSKLRKILDVFYIKIKILNFIKLQQIDKILCKGVIAGAFGYFIWCNYKIPFYVDSFEPHADYMAESGTWNRLGVKYLMQKMWERKQMCHATKIFPVTNNYKSFLYKKGVSKKRMEVVPVCVEIEKFKYDSTRRNKIREKLKINNKIVGVYVGKFGDIYHRDEAYDLFESCFKFYGRRFFLIILTPEKVDLVHEGLLSRDIDKNDFDINYVSHDMIPDFLSAADFAISMIKPTRYSRFCSPTKHGEYWANGLPLILTENISDDSMIVEVEDIGAIIRAYNGDSYFEAITKIDNLLKEDTFFLRKRITNIAERYRSFENGDKIIKEIEK